MREVFICDAIRTPIGRFGGGLSAVRADDLAAGVDQALIDMLGAEAVELLIEQGRYRRDVY